MLFCTFVNDHNIWFCTWYCFIVGRHVPFAAVCTLFSIAKLLSGTSAGALIELKWVCISSQFNDALIQL